MRLVSPLTPNIERCFESLVEIAATLLGALKKADFEIVVVGEDPADSRHISNTPIR
jgi:hypothetical protein